MLEVAPVEAVLRASAQRSAAQIRRLILDLVVAHAGPTGVGDDLTVVVAKALAEDPTGDATGGVT